MQYGPPGSGKTLLARTVSELMETDKVTLVNTPDIMQKYLGESEKMVRSYFEPAGLCVVKLCEPFPFKT